MSTFKVEVVSIESVMAHPNAHSLDLCQVHGWQVVAAKSKFKAGDKAVYIPIDSVLSPNLEARLFPAGSKITLNKSRVKSIKIRGALSQGMLVDLDSLENWGLISNYTAYDVGQDVTGELGVVKYEPPVRDLPSHMQTASATKKQANTNFRKYTDIENLKNYTQAFEPGELVYVTEKLHGTSARYALLPTEANTVWKRIKKFFGLLPAYEFCIGSRNVQLQGNLNQKTWYDTNVYAKIALETEFASILKPGEAVYGEIVGHNIQKGYDYGHPEGEFSFVAYDVMKDGQWLSPNDFKAWCDERNIPRVPVLYEGPYDAALANELRSGDSVYCPTQKVREGVVIKPMTESTSYFGRKVLKFINDDYLLKDQTDFH